MSIYKDVRKFFKGTDYGNWAACSYGLCKFLDKASCDGWSSTKYEYDVNVLLDSSLTRGLLNHFRSSGEVLTEINNGIMEWERFFNLIRVVARDEGKSSGDKISELMQKYRVYKREIEAINVSALLFYCVEKGLNHEDLLCGNVAEDSAESEEEKKENALEERLKNIESRLQKLESVTKVKKSGRIKKYIDGGSSLNTYFGADNWRELCSMFGEEPMNLGYCEVLNISDIFSFHNSNGNVSFNFMGETLCRFVYDVIFVEYTDDILIIGTDTVIFNPITNRYTVHPYEYKIKEGDDGVRYINYTF